MPGITAPPATGSDSPPAGAAPLPRTEYVCNAAHFICTGTLAPPLYRSTTCVSDHCQTPCAAFAPPSARFWKNSPGGKAQISRLTVRQAATLSGFLVALTLSTRSGATIRACGFAAGVRLRSRRGIFQSISSLNSSRNRNAGSRATATGSRSAAAGRQTTFYIRG